MWIVFTDLKKVVFGFGLYLRNLGYWIYICLYLDLKVFGLNLMNQLYWIASVYYQLTPLSSN